MKQLNITTQSTEVKERLRILLEEVETCEHFVNRNPGFKYRVVLDLLDLEINIVTNIRVLRNNRRQMTRERGIDKGKGL